MRGETKLDALILRGCFDRKLKVITYVCERTAWWAFNDSQSGLRGLSISSEDSLGVWSVGIRGVQAKSISGNQYQTLGWQRLQIFFLFFFFLNYFKYALKIWLAIMKIKGHGNRLNLKYYGLYVCSNYCRQRASLSLSSVLKLVLMRPTLK